MFDEKGRGGSPRSWRDTVCAGGFAAPKGCVNVSIDGMPLMPPGDLRYVTETTLGLSATLLRHIGSLQPITRTEAAFAPTCTAFGLAACTTTRAVRSPVTSTVADSTAAPESSV